MLCSSLTCRISCVYYASNSARCSTCTFDLPFALVVRPIPPIKTATYKVQLDCDMKSRPVVLQHLFQDLFGNQIGSPSEEGGNDRQSLQGSQAVMSAEGGSSVLSLQMRSATNLDVTILVSKSAGRVCVQSSEFGGLFLVCNEVVKRLRKAHIDIQFQESLPLHDYFSVRRI
jgi:hypothetical protein